jgi:epoxyqueuosine reductase
MAATVTNAPAEGSISRTELTRIVKAAVLAEGFDQVGIAAATPGLGADRLVDWIADGRHGEMDYMQRHLDARRDPNSVLEGVRSVVVGALNYKTKTTNPLEAGEGRISRYAWGRDYHDVLRTKLQNAAAIIQASAPGENFRAVVDSAPLMERDYASLAGMGWFGKNTLLLNRKLGSFFFLGALLTTADLAADAPFEADHCGSCTKCLDSCPTNAFDGPYRLDPRRCISYLTIEHRGSIDESLAKGMGDWVFGCDVCQDVCPWNRKPPTANVPEFRPTPGMNPVSLESALTITDAEFRQRFRGTPLFRIKRHRFVRNALIAAVNQKCRELLPAVRRLADDENQLIRTTAHWALERL